MNKKLVGVIATGTIVIAGVAIGLGLKLKSTPDDQFTPSVPASSVVQTIDETETPATVDVNNLTPDEASQIAEGTGAAQQGEGESLEGEMENPPQGTPEGAEDTEQPESGRTLQPGDTYVNEAGLEVEIVDFEKDFNEAIENITPEELKALQDLNLTFG